MNSIFTDLVRTKPLQQLVCGTLKLIFIFAFTVIICGCGEGYDVSLYPVTGSVNLDGQKTANVFVEFQPVGTDKQPRGANGYTDENGNFELVFLKSKGCPEGAFEAHFSIMGSDEESEPSSLSQVETVAVSAGGDNVFNFDLTSDDQ